VKRAYSLFLVALIASIAASAIVGEALAARTSGFDSVYLRKTKLGKILVNTAGTTLFAFSKDPLKKDTCIQHAGCTANWIPQDETTKPTAGPGVHASLLSTIPVEGGQQLTYAGHPLYIDSASTKAGQTSYVGTKQFGGTWDAINAKGHAVK
jgi:predicted lipoprotein with Yx(FWY)xxD motif